MVLTPIDVEGPGGSGEKKKEIVSFNFSKSSLWSHTVSEWRWACWGTLLCLNCITRKADRTVFLMSCQASAEDAMRERMQLKCMWVYPQGILVLH